MKSNLLVPLGAGAWLLVWAAFAQGQPKPERPPRTDAGEEVPLPEAAPPAPAPAAEPSPAERPGTEESAEPEPARRKPTSKAPLEDEEAEEPLIPPASDNLAGHFALSPGIAWVAPLGSLADGLPQSDRVGGGPAFTLEASIGVSRAVAIGVWGQLASFGSGDECADCSASSVAGGAFVRYHLVQGVRFDPWMSAGVGFRSTTLERSTGDESYSGIEWLRLAVGGDWYAFSLFGIGPFLELDMGIYGSRPDDGRSSAIHSQLLVGARLTLDVPGK